MNETIIALATASGSGAIAIIRISGKDAISIADSVFKAHHGRSLANSDSHTVHLGYFFDNKTIIDECLATIFKGNKSYTGEPTVEFSCHGSIYIIQQVIKVFLSKGCRLAKAGEFTLRAFLNGKMDLSQAEAVADLIASDSEAAHAIAMKQMRGGFTSEIEELRTELLNFASLIELELDFSEEDVEFADRNQFRSLLSRIQTTIKRLMDSFATGNVIKNGVPVAIVGKPNAGKSTLLNVLLNEERAIVSDIAGTTRDTIEEVLHIGGTAFRFIDTAGIRETSDKIEEIGVKKAKEKITQANVLLYLYDELDNQPEEVIDFVKEVYRDDLKIILLHNKVDVSGGEFGDFDRQLKSELVPKYTDIILGISAKENINIDILKSELATYAESFTSSENNVIISNSRHYEALSNALAEIIKVQEGLEMNLSGDLLAIDIREALYHLGTISGEVTNDEVLGNIFANFCIGK
ncbi:tRNA modification GTPase mnmE [Capnocytophaga canimorsus Cc5]|uniref:tRNA modification GTPase MnmE n=1 Tax=Capnocytophaga canimorsus (strain 5) TaxID=860228 RepID=F9YVD1_CAPCC|nr:tRNA uridine-5-carboxymethylaminomethyl(34) synthesis GTPase MnmE [Capnocytophaga canimorsus]AEK23176.1 tRNA modification GTPase mnmE [Capnocytophaga canimorsus Cc5]WGU71101.1 tRNA uridine-5-carboxymethylaminomethyl(34) synthesis GTPase MnmE [Capnocytophaga canimorsus]